jgi:hypothetical protein
MGHSLPPQIASAGEGSGEESSSALPRCSVCRRVGRPVE